MTDKISHPAYGTRSQLTLFADSPVPGFYRRRLVKGGPWVPALIYLRCPIDPESGHPLDRSPLLLCRVNGEERDAVEQWSWVAGQKITEAEYLYLEALRTHTEEYEPDHPAARGREPINQLTAPLPY